HSFLLRAPRPPTSTLFPYTTLFRSARLHKHAGVPGHGAIGRLFPTCVTIISCDNRRRGLFAALQRIGLHAHMRQTALFVSQHLRSEEHTSELQSRENLVCRLLLEKK